VIQKLPIERVARGSARFEDRLDIVEILRAASEEFVDDGSFGSR